MIDKNQFLKILHDIYENHMPFNRILGIKIESLTMDHVCVKIEMNDNLIGNPRHNILHGGVISSVLDLTGGIIAQTSVLKKIDLKSFDEMAKKFTNMSTINLSVDFLRPGKGNEFYTTASVLRSGKKVAVTRMEFKNEKDELIAAGSGSYLVG